MILNREEDESLRVLLEEGLISFLWLDCWCNCHNGLYYLDFLDDGLLHFDSVDDWRVGIER
jgi:hypothetical protein